ncbi:hypothetical protein WNY37_17015 [Henriciella sp. AS95]|uniref:hypothetical protein n=1 Tax=Henriciella sp. AS95 TaxID=3135782 RepID=UPI003170C6D1
MTLKTIYLTASLAFILAGCSEPADAPAPAPAPEESAVQPAETPAAPADDGFVPVTLTGFECGDNCYVEIIETEGDAPEMVLCTADICWGDWQAEGSLPPELDNTTAEVKFDVADQVDNEGNVMEADMRAVVELRLIEE